MLCSKIGAALHIREAIFRDWIASNTWEYDPNHRAIIKTLQQDYDVAEIIRNWPPHRNAQTVNTKFGHIHRAVKNSFNQARARIAGTFADGCVPTAAPRERVGELRLNANKDPAS
jgi:hypothetical protein